jgi:SAM-dependent methyltransferase
LEIDLPESRGVSFADRLKPWLPNDDYHAKHLARLAFSFSKLPPMPKGFSCISIGSWGTEAPYLTEVLGASRVACVRGPESGVPDYEVRHVRAPASTRDARVEVYAVNAEREPLPESLRDFDLCICWEILEHLCHDPPFLVWQAIQTLKIGGFLSLTTPNALWHYLTTAQVFGENALGLRLQPHIPFATHWRLYSPKEVAQLSTRMGCRLRLLTTFLDTEPFSLKSRVFLWLVEYFRRRSGNGDVTVGQLIYLLGQKQEVQQPWRPEWLFPPTVRQWKELKAG